MIQPDSVPEATAPPEHHADFLSIAARKCTTFAAKSEPPGRPLWQLPATEKRNPYLDLRRPAPARVSPRVAQVAPRKWLTSKPLVTCPCAGPGLFNSKFRSKDS